MDSCLAYTDWNIRPVRMMHRSAMNGFVVRRCSLRVLPETNRTLSSPDFSMSPLSSKCILYRYFKPIWVFLTSGFTWAMVNAGKSASNRDLLAPAEGNPDSASPTWCLTVVRGTNATLTSDRHSGHLTSFPAASIMFIVHWSELWPVHTKSPYARR